MTQGNWENSAGLGVYNHYGVRGTQDGVVAGGKLPVQGAVDEAVVYITGSDFDGSTSFTTKTTLPAGAIVLESYCEVTDAFTLGNADNDIYVGTSTGTGTDITTDFVFQIANPAATGTTSDAPAGDFAAALASAVTLEVAVSGTTAAASAGNAKVVIRYTKI